MKLLSLQSGPLTQGERAILNQALQSQWWTNPLLNPEAGTVEPAPKYAGLVAYADGVSWNPGGTGIGMYFYTGAAWKKLVRNDDTFFLGLHATADAAVDSDKVDGKHFTDFPFTKEFISAEQTITAAGSLTLAHGLGVMPKFTHVLLKCQTAELGYSIGDSVIAGHANDATYDRGVSIVPDATNLNIRFSVNDGSFSIINKTTGAIGGILNARWKAIFKSWA